ncbi:MULTISPECIES: phosphopantetheine-binding protein [unclassified Streptomyces]|uniref:phosphopantetheine-binding protein n=1 Tax=unclassified Streptomyces TaxID=2593676 RepID=UPI0016531C0E|nr:phosphopantetheine-binding protein [Streptomyces sp. sk2.1]
MSAALSGATGSVEGPADTGSPVAYDPPLTPVEHTLATAFTEVLGIERVGRQDNFLDLGGDSVAAMSVRARARRAGLDVSAHRIMRSETLADLAGSTRSIAEATRAVSEAARSTAVAPQDQRWDQKTIDQLRNGIR